MEKYLKDLCIKIFTCV